MENFIKKSLQGFTLIELLVVIAIIGILSGIVLVSLGGARAQARDAVRQSDMRQVISAQEMYYADDDKYYNVATQDGVPAIGTYLSLLHDPQLAGGHVDYKWQGNTAALDCTDNNLDASAQQWFCVYSTLEEKSATSANKIYFAASHRGAKKLDLAVVPTVATDCTCF